MGWLATPPLCHPTPILFAAQYVVTNTEVKSVNLLQTRERWLSFSLLVHGTAKMHKSSLMFGGGGGGLNRHLQSQRLIMLAMLFPVMQLAPVMGR